MLATIQTFFNTIISYSINCLETLPYFFERLKWFVNRPEPWTWIENPLEDKIVLVTGANSGLGKASVLELVRRGAHVVLACRRLNEGEKAIHEIRTETGAGEMTLMKLDLASLKSIRTFVEEFKSKYSKLDILINNAGFHDASSERKKTDDGFEQHIGVNHLGPFLLTNLLIEHLKKGGKESRVITISSHSVAFENLNLGDLMMESADYGYFNLSPYANSKYANALFAKELARRVQAIQSYSMAPGLVTSKFYDSNRPWYQEAVVRIGLGMFGESPAQGCDTILYLATTPANLLEGGKFFHYRHAPRRINQKLTHESKLANELWDLSAKLVDL